MNNNAKIQELRNRYKESFIEKSATLDELLILLPVRNAETVKGILDREESCGEIHEYVHKLAGSSGMYDYSDIAELSRKAMRSSKEGEVQLLIEQIKELRDLLRHYAKV